MHTTHNLTHTYVVVGGTHCAPWLSGDSSWKCMFCGKRVGGLTGQPVGPLVGTATMSAVMSADRVDSGSFILRCCTFRRTHTSADPIRLLRIRLALSLTLSLPSRLGLSARFTVGVPPRALWLAEIFLLCAGVVGTRTD